MKDEFQEQDIIYGRNSVREALKKGREIESLYVLEGERQGSMGEILKLAKREHVLVREVAHQKLDSLVRPYGYEGKPANHQGVVARVTSYTFREVEDILAYARQKNQPPFIVALDGVKDPHNFGAIIRSAEVLGAHGVIIAKRRNAPLSAAAMKAACGACEYLPVAKVTNLNQTLEILKEQGIFVASAVMGGTEISKVNLKGAMCIVIGGEDEGVSQNIVKNSDFQVGIPMMGNINSLNASCAAAVIIYEKIRQDREGK